MFQTTNQTIIILLFTPSIPPAFAGISTIDPRHKVSCVDTCHQRARGHMVVQLEPSWASHETKKNDVDTCGLMGGMTQQLILYIYGIIWV